MTVPDAFARRMARVHGEAGIAWIAALPALLCEIEREWEIKIDPPVPNLTYNFVAPASNGESERFMLKLLPGGGEGDREAVAMAAFGGHGAARLVRHDSQRRAMLLERIAPAHGLRAIPDPVAVLIAAGVLEKLWQAPVPARLEGLREWTATLDRFAEDPRSVPRDHLERASSLRQELLVDPPERVVLHGDLHHTNVLFSEGRGWLAIDPKGIVGEKAFDILFFLLNPEPVPLARNLLRIETFVERLKLDRERVVAWSYVQSVVSACWTVEDGGTDISGAIGFAEDLRSIL